MTGLQREGDSDTFKLTERNAFAWPEVYFPGIGWVEFSPTPSQPRINRPGTPAVAPQPSEAPDPNLRGEGPIDLGIGSADPGKQPATDEPGGGSSPWPMIIALAVVGGLAIAAAGAGKVAWEFGLSGMPRPVQVWEKTLRLASLGKTGARPAETPREFAARLSRDVPGTGAARYIAAVYERTRFGKKALADDETERLEAAWASLRRGLMRRVLRLRAPASGDD